jgi:hypothetical protein
VIGELGALLGTGAKISNALITFFYIQRFKVFCDGLVMLLVVCKTRLYSQV